MNKQRLQIIAVAAVVLFGGGMLYLRMGPGSEQDIPPEALKIIQAADDAEFADDAPTAIAERTGAVKAERGSARLSSDGGGDLPVAETSDEEPEIGAKKKVSPRRKKGKRKSSQDDAYEEDDGAIKSGKKITPNKTAS